MVDVKSRYSVTETLDRLEVIVKARGLLVFARIDFSGDAERSGLSLRPMQMLLFGNPRTGTPILAMAPRAGLDLPLKALAWRDPDGFVWVSSIAPHEIAERYRLSDALVGPLGGARSLIEQAAK
jgi:uncharacterized protein (DUF302 family)